MLPSGVAEEQGVTGNRLCLDKGSQETDRLCLDKSTAGSPREGACGLLGRQVGSVGALWTEAHRRQTEDQKKEAAV